MSKKVVTSVAVLMLLIILAKNIFPDFFEQKMINNFTYFIMGTCLGMAIAYFLSFSKKQG